MVRATIFWKRVRATVSTSPNRANGAAGSAISDISILVSRPGSRAAEKRAADRSRRPQATAGRNLGVLRWLPAASRSELVGQGNAVGARIPGQVGGQPKR